MSIGLIGLGSIGKNLALNIQKSEDLHVFNRTPEKIAAVVEKGDNVHGHTKLGDMISDMKQPRTVFTALPHGEVTDSVVKDLVKILDPDDTIIDCSNEYYRNSRMRGAHCSAKGVNYLGTGLSGGSNGALTGPALMIGGPQDVYERHVDLFDTFCKNYAYMGNDYGIGHFTKMVHNGVEYGMLQGVADVYAYCNQNMFDMSKVLVSLKETDIDGYILDCAIKVLQTYNIDKISDVAEMNNTGLWCTQTGIEYQIPTPVINSAVNTRMASRYAKCLNTNDDRNPLRITAVAANTLRFVFASSILEGYELMSTRNVSREQVAHAWSSGTIIECPMIGHECYDVLEETIDDVRTFVHRCTQSGIPCPAVQAALTHYDFMHRKKTSINFLMAQRNHFGQHSITEA